MLGSAVSLLLAWKLRFAATAPLTSISTCLDLSGLQAKNMQAPADLLAGEARHESIFKMTDLHFAGCGSAEGSIRSASRDKVGYAS
jgi:hypothetical protein